MSIFLHILVGIVIFLVGFYIGEVGAYAEMLEKDLKEGEFHK